MNEPLINWHAIDGNIALRALRETNGWAGDASDKNMLNYSRLIREKRGAGRAAGLNGRFDRADRAPQNRTLAQRPLRGRTDREEIMTPEANAIVYCEGAYNTLNGKTAHGLVRFTRRYRVIAVVDSRHAGQDAGETIDGKANGIPVTASIEDALTLGRQADTPATHLVIGIAPRRRASGPPGPPGT